MPVCISLIWQLTSSTGFRSRGQRRFVRLSMLKFDLMGKVTCIVGFFCSSFFLPKRDDVPHIISKVSINQNSIILVGNHITVLSEEEL